MLTIVSLALAPVWIASATTPCEVARLTGAADAFGFSVHVNGDVAIVGTYQDDDPGSAHIYRTDGFHWTEEDALAAFDGVPGDRYGISVAIAGDVAVVGATRAYPGTEDPGAVYVYRRDGTGWDLEARHGPAAGDPYDCFGRSVAISGARILVGAYGDDDAAPGAGAAYVLRHDGSAWIEEDKMVPDDGEASDWFGWSVDLDGDAAIIGSWWDDDQGFASGSAYVYRRDGSAWRQEAKLLPSVGASFYRFGTDVAIDGDVAAAGTRFDYDRDAPDRSITNFACVFRRQGQAWVEEQVLLGRGTGYEDEDWFGAALCLQEQTLLVGAYGTDNGGLGSGAAYLYRLAGTTWSEEAVLRPSRDDGRFGWAVDLDGDAALVGAMHGAGSGGAAYAYRGVAEIDCNANGLADVCEVFAGTTPDCNDNGVPDECDVRRSPVVRASGQLRPIGHTAPQQYAIASPPPAVSDVVLTFAAHADLNSHLEYVDVEVNGEPAGSVFVTGAADCSEPPDVDALTVPMALFNAPGGSGGAAVIDMLPTPGVSATACQGDSWIEVTVEYDTATSPDRNGNGVPDECECFADVNGDGVVDVLDLLQVLLAWGPCPGCATDVNGDGVVDTLDLLEVLTSWGPC